MARGPARGSARRREQRARHQWNIKGLKKQVGILAKLGFGVGGVGFGTYDVAQGTLHDFAAGAAGVLGGLVTVAAAARRHGQLHPQQKHPQQEPPEQHQISP